MHETDVLTIPASQILPGDVFWEKGQYFAVKRIEPLTQFLIRIHGNVMSFECSLVVDSRLLFQAVMRDVVTEPTVTETNYLLCMMCLKHIAPAEYDQHVKDSHRD